MARRWPAGDRYDQRDDSVKSLSLHDIMPKAGVAELADARDLKSFLDLAAVTQIRPVLSVS